MAGLRYFEGAMHPQNNANPTPFHPVCVVTIFLDGMRRESLWKME